MILEVTEIETYYGISHILFGVSLSVDQGEVVALLGRNGAGKTTTMRSIMGLTPPRKGSIVFRGADIARREAHLVARDGVGYVPADRRIFGKLTVRQNLEVAQKPNQRGEVRWSVERIHGLFPKLRDLDSHKARTLSGGEAQMLATARTLMGNPDLLLLDEPSTGLAPLVVKALGEQVVKLKAEDLSVILAEQNAKFGMSISDRCYVIDKGSIRYSGTIEELRQQEQLMHTYLAV